MESKLEEFRQLAEDILSYARNMILLSLPYLSPAVFQLKPLSRDNLGGLAMDGRHLLYDFKAVLQAYRRDKNQLNRLYLHSILHGLFCHSFNCRHLVPNLWSLAVDIAVENTILDFKLSYFKTGRDSAQRQELDRLSRKVGALTAEKVYRYLLDNPALEIEAWQKLFFQDKHDCWLDLTPQKEDKDYLYEETEANSEDWAKISRQVKTELELFSQKMGDLPASLEQNIQEAHREKYDYGEFLKKFAVTNEDLQINDEEFDYIFYTYGLKLYQNMPLIEPLEYQETRRIKDFVIALDTSGSCSGEVVQAFLDKTYAILSSRESFFAKINLHLLQCDMQIQKDSKITSWEDFKNYLATEKLTGFGGTDFRPVFRRVEELLQSGELTNLKGLIYFTDGYGTFPETVPPYPTAFVFVENNQVEVPPWGIKLVLDSQEIIDGKQIRKGWN